MGTFTLFRYLEFYTIFIEYNNIEGQVVILVIPDIYTKTSVHLVYIQICVISGDPDHPAPSCRLDRESAVAYEHTTHKRVYYKHTSMQIILKS